MSPKSPKKQGKKAPRSAASKKGNEEDISGAEESASTDKNAFEKEVEHALEHYFDEPWLEQHSPLAAPYFIGKFIAAELIPDNKVLKRGKALKFVIDLAIKDLLATDTSSGLLPKEIDKRKREGKTIKAYYCDPKYRDIDKRAVMAAFDLDIAYATFFRAKFVGIIAVAEFIRQQVIPPLIGEKPVQRNLVGRDPQITHALKVLRQRRVYALAGPSGIGKTSLGLALADEWNREQIRDRVMWFTLRPGLNDSLTSLVFSIAYFLKSQGVETTWTQLVANHGEIKNESAISGLIRHDLNQLKSAPLICIDEVGILQLESKEQSKIIRFLEGLFDSAAILLMGHHMPFKLPRVKDCKTLDGLKSEDLDQLLILEGLSAFAEQHRISLLRLTKGNPALIHLVIALHWSGESIEACLQRIAKDPSAEALLHQILECSSATECEFLNMLAVYDGLAPADEWHAPESKAILAKFLKFGLVNEDSSGGILVSPFIRGFVLDRMLADIKTQCHAKAAQAREKRGEFTSAAWHYAQVGLYKLTLRIWAVHREEEMNKGHAGTAMAIFRLIQQSQLVDPDDQRLYSHLFAKLLVANGEGQKATEVLEQIHWPPEHVLTPTAEILMGDAYEMQNHFKQSIAAYDRAIDALRTHPHAQKSIAYRHRGFAGIRDGSLMNARNDAALALLEAENFMGNTEEMIGHYDDAREHYERALKITLGLSNNLSALHNCHANLGLLAWRQERMTESFMHLHKALAYSTQLHSVTGMLVDKIYLSGAHIIAKQYQQALDIAEEGLQQALPTQLTYDIAGLYTNAAESLYYLGQLDKAMKYASQAIRLEEDPHQPSAFIVMGMAQRDKGELMAADQSFTLAIAIAGQTEDKYALAAAWRELGELRICQHQIHDAKNALTQSITLFREMYNEPQAKKIEARLNAL